MSGKRCCSLESIALRVARPLAIVLLWCAVLALGMRYFFSPFGAVEEPTFGDLTGFGFGFTITGLVAASVALVVAGKRRWALEIALAAGVMMAALGVLAYVALWAGALDPAQPDGHLVVPAPSTGGATLWRGDPEFLRAGGRGSGRCGWGDVWRVDRDRPPAGATGEIDRPGIARYVRDGGRAADPFRRRDRLGNGHQLAVLDWSHDPGTRVGHGHDLRRDHRGVRRVAGDPGGWAVASRLSFRCGGDRGCGPFTRSTMGGAGWPIAKDQHFLASPVL